MRIDWTPNNAAMDNVADPVIDRWRLNVDGVPRAITGMTWVSGTRFEVTYAGGAAVTYAQLQQNSTDFNVFNTNGVLAQPPNVGVAYV